MKKLTTRQSSPKNLFLSLICFALTATGFSQVPTITSFAPSSGQVGTNVTITGTNFSATTTSNIVWFGATQATVTSASATQLVVTVPVGASYQPFSVTVGGNTAYSQVPFKVTFPSSQVIDATTFQTASAVVLTSGLIPYSPIVADFDGDGKPDLATINTNSITLSVFRNTSTTGSITAGSFAPRVDFTTGTGPYKLAVGDIDGDGKPDLIVTNWTSNTISVFRNTSTTGSITTSSFAPRIDFNTGTNPGGLAIGDIDGDGKPDISVTSYGSNLISVFRNISTPGTFTIGSLAPRVDFTTGTNPASVTVGDIDGDTKPDIVITNYSSNNISVFRNISTSGTFTISSLSPKVDFTVGTNPYGIVIGDIDGDGKQDISVTNSNGSSFSVLRNVSASGSITTSSLSPKVDLTTTGVNPQGIAMGDIDGDGKPDLIIVNYSSSAGNVSIFKNISSPGSIGTGSFAPKVDFNSGGTGPWDACISDIDGDGKPDVSIVNGSSGTVSVLRNTITPVAIPTITSFSPAFGPAGTTVTITGTNFSTTASSNIVWFGAAQATVSSATATQLIVTVPTGATYQPLSVTVNGYTDFSSSPYILTFQSAQVIDATSFPSKADIGSGTSPEGTAISDIDGDGKPDLLVVNNASNTLSVYRNISATGSLVTGSFAAKVDFATGSNPTGVAVSDIDGDGKPDVVVSNYGSNTISVFRNTSSSGTIALSAKVDLATGISPYGVAIGDIEGDGRPDIAVTNNGGTTVSVFQNIGSQGSITTASFSNKTDFTSGSYPSGVVISDIDGDGKADLVIANTGSNTLSVLRNTSVSGIISNSSFAGKTDFSTGNAPLFPAVGDIDGDGKPDIAVSCANSNTISLFRNTSTSGSFTTSSLTPKVDLSTPTNPYVVAIGDLDGDGKPDIATVNYSSNLLSVFKNNNSAGQILTTSFAARIDYNTGVNPFSVRIGDLDGDGKADLLVSNYNSATISVFRNSVAAAIPPVITSFTPSSGQAGSLVTITGTNFNTTASNNSVWFGAVQATVLSASATQLTVRVPMGSTSQPISVTNLVNGLTAYSNIPFATLFPSSQTIDLSTLAGKVDISASSGPSNATLSDLDCDGKPDLIVANLGSGTVSIYRNISSTGTLTAASFAAKFDLSSGSGPTSVVAEDVDGDGKPDLIVTNQYSYTVSIFRNISTAGALSASSFAPRVDYSTGYSPTGVALADLDGDGRPDMVIANQQSNTMSVYLNSATPGIINALSFATKLDFITGTNPQYPVLADIDGDKKPDIIINIYGGTNISVFRNTFTTGSLSTSSLAPYVDIPTGTKPYFAAAGDLDGDGKTDLVVANQSSNSISILRNIATSGSITTASFAGKVDLTTNTSPMYVALSDLDGDGKADIEVANQTSNNISVFKNISTSGSLTTSSFNPKIDFTSGTNPYSFAIGDIDLDGKPDLVSTNYGATTISLLRNIIAGPPIISTVTPSAGQTGSSVIISGANFSTTAANNAVWFGAVQSTVSAASANQLKVVVPSGTTYQPVSVTVGGLTDYSPLPFNVTFATNQVIDANAIATKVDLTGNNNPFGTAFADIDGDGKADLIVANSNTNNISIFRNTSTSGAFTTSTFAPKVDFTTGTTPYNITIADLDGDGKPDIVVSDFGSAQVSVFRNQSTSGTISLATIANLTAGSNPYGIAVSDIDGDGKPDIIVSNAGSSTVSVFRNISTSGTITTGSFSGKVDFPTASSPYGVAVGDIDSDGKPDIVTANNGANSISFLKNTSTQGSISSSSFAGKIDIATGAQPRMLLINDIDGDGKPDIAVSNYNSASVSIFRNTSTPGSVSTTTLTKTDITTGTNPFFISIGDIDGDGKPDLAVTNTGSTSVSVFKNNSIPGSVTMALKADYPTGTNPYGVSIADIDNDSKPDLAVANNGAATVSIFRNTTASLTVPVISTVSPASGPVGSSVVITGTNFSTTAASNIVWFGATKATVTAATATQLTVTVPACANYQPLSITAGGYTTYYSTPFNVTFISSQIINTNTFLPKVDFTSGTTPIHTAIGDIDGDGKPDLVVANSGSGTVSVYRNQSTAGTIILSSFSSKVDITVGTNPGSVGLCDIDGDGKLDLVVVNNGSNSISVFRNIATSGTISLSSFATKVDYATGVSPGSIDFGDIDGDGRPDLAVPNKNASTVSIFRNTSVSGSVSLSSKVDIATWTNPSSAVLTDVDGDRKPDLVVACTANNLISVYRNLSAYGSISTSSFATSVDFTTGSSPMILATGDIDGDGKPDLIVTNNGSSSISILRNNGLTGSITSASYAGKVDFTTGTNPYDIAVGDIDGDGKPEIAVTNITDNTVSVFQNTSTSGSITASSLSAKSDFSTGTSPFGLSVGDLDGDTKPDILFANSGAATISVIRNNIALKMLIGSITPTTGAIGATVTINGANLGFSASNNSVWFGAVKATVSAASSSQLTVTVPNGATYQPISITNTTSGNTAYSATPFNVTFSSSQIFDANTFATKADFTTSTGPYFSALADIDGDGKSDLIVTDYNNNTISIYRNTGTSGSMTTASFFNKYDYTTGNNPYGLAVGDVDGDGKPDIVVVNYGSSTVSVFKNTATSGIIGASSLAPKVDFATGANPYHVAIVDIDGDGKPDMVVTNNGAATISLFQNTGIQGSVTTSSFAPKVDLSTGSGPGGIATGDIDGDGKPDIVVANSSSNTISVFRNISTFGTISTSSFAGLVNFSTGSKPTSVALGDIDGDLKTDICVTNYNSSTISIFRNSSVAGTISIPSRFDPTVGTYPVGIAVCDLDGDGKPDIAVTNSNSSNFSVFKNTCTSGTIAGGSLGTRADYSTGTGSGPMGISLGDLDTDGKPDICVVNNTLSTITVFRNNLLLPPTAPTIGTITQPTCKVTTASVVLNGLPSSGSWTVTRSPGSVTNSGTGATYTVTGISPGTYTFTVSTTSNGVSPSSASVVITTVPKGVVPKIKKKWNDLLICYNVGDSLAIYQWYIGNSAIGGANSQTYKTNKSAGLYKVRTTDVNGCTNFSDTLSIKGTKSLNIYPNPAKESVTITMSDEQTGHTLITFISQSGRKVLEIESDKVSEDFIKEIPVSNLEQGFYFVVVSLNRIPIYNSKIMIVK
jgi:6-phosphogluconolactonase (cycloisomerase 2 family)